MGAVNHSRKNVVEEVGANGAAVERVGGRHVVAVAVRLREVNHGVGDRAGTGDIACGEVVSVEVERLAGIHRDLSEHLVVDEREVVECLVDQRVGERAGAGTLRLEPLARGAAVAHRVVEADGAAGVLRGNEVELQVPLRVIDLERIEEVGRPVSVGGCGAGGVRCEQAELRADREAGGDSERAVRHLRARKGVCDRNRPGVAIGDDGVLCIGDDGIALLDGDGGGGRVGIGRAVVVEDADLAAIVLKVLKRRERGSAHRRARAPERLRCVDPYRTPRHHDLVRRVRRVAGLDLDVRVRLEVRQLRVAVWQAVGKRREDCACRDRRREHLVFQ